MAQHEKQGVSDMEIVVVDDEPCPECGAFWGNPECDFPNRAKVHDEHGWWWRCYNPGCSVGYYIPGTDKIERKAVAG
jgi:hypothetical protein